MLMCRVLVGWSGLFSRGYKEIASNKVILLFSWDKSVCCSILYLKHVTLIVIILFVSQQFVVSISAILIVKEQFHLLILLLSPAEVAVLACF